MQKVRKIASQPPIVFVSIAAFAGVIALIIALFVFNWTRWLLLLLIPGILSLFLLIQAGYNVQGTGFSDKKLWHWIKLLFQAIAALAIPISIIVGLNQFNAQQAANAHTALEQQQETTLQTYLDNIQDLLLNHNLLGDSPPPKTDAARVTIKEIQELARVRTLTTLRRLDADHNRIVLRFLQDAHLIGIQDAVINLSNADLSNDDLSGTDLSGTDLSGATLNSAHLSGATLSDATLSGAILNDARNLTQPQLDTVYSCTKAMLSTGLTCHHNRGGSMVTLTYWYTEASAETPVILQLIQQFQQQNPDIRINAVYKPFFQAQAAFINASQAGNAPDVLRSDVGWVTQFASQRYLLKIDSYVSRRDLSDYLSVPLSYDQYNGHLYGLPQVTDFLALLYNKAELAKVGFTSPPATMSDFEAAAMKIVQSKAATYGFETDGESYFALPFLWAFGGGMIDLNNNILVNNAGSVAGLSFLLKLQNTDQVMPAKVDFSNGYTNMVNDFKNGETAMIFDGPWEVSNILTGSAFTGNTSNLGIAGIPTGPGEQTGSPVGGQSYVISAGTKHAAEAYKFISFMSSTASQIAIAQANHTLPTRNSAYQDPRVSRDSVISAFHAIQNTAIARPAIPAGGYLFDAFDSNIQAALDGAKRPTDALNTVADAWKQLLAS